ncbi:MAG: 16S rRNA (guanine(966)-N(2))-methyltransferase RsmD [Bdellovibrionaceae bacterium]|nr:16S rRNA (guanine(966)-N(2))-methyltransferase RsmD [Pseudobdellovibrionaceae bacterium]
MIRITGGEWKNHSLLTPHHRKTRPTHARLREALFHSVLAWIPEARVLDLFAGSGALGFEALSRGAAHVDFVEVSQSACDIIKKNIRQFNVQSKVRVFCSDFEKWSFQSFENKYDLVLADPPYSQGFEKKLIHKIEWQNLLNDEGLFCLESAKRDGVWEASEFLVKIREKTYGDSQLTTFQKRENQTSEVS